MKRLIVAIASLALLLGTAYHPQFDVMQWEDLQVLGVSSRLPSANYPGLAKIKDNGAGSIGVWALHFDKSSTEYIHFSVQLPHSWREGDAIRPHIHWLPITTGGGNVVWRLEYNVATPTGTFGNTTVDDITEAAGTTAFVHLVDSFDEIAMTNMGASTFINGTLARIGGDGADTLDDDAVLLGFDFHYRRSQNGTLTEWE